MSNLGGTFPRFFVLKFVDAFSRATCTPPSPDSKFSTPLKGPLITQAFSCVLEAEKHRCTDGGGVCTMQRDGTSIFPSLRLCEGKMCCVWSILLTYVLRFLGYYIVNILCVMFGIVTFWGFIRPAAMKLQALPLRAWRGAAT